MTRLLRSPTPTPVSSFIFSRLHRIWSILPSVLYGFVTPRTSRSFFSRYWLLIMETSAASLRPLAPMAMHHAYDRSTTCTFPMKSLTLPMLLGLS